MKAVFAIGIVALLAGLTPAGAVGEDIRARNVVFLRDWVDMDLDTPVVLPDGRAGTLREAIDEVARRAGDVELGSPHLSTPKAPTIPWSATPQLEGDLWILERGTGLCDARVVAPQPVDVPAWPYAALHGGYLGTLSTTHGWSTTIISWTTGEAIVEADTLGFTATGSIDDYCVSFEGGHFSFPFVSGVAQVNRPSPAC